MANIKQLPVIERQGGDLRTLMLSVMKEVKGIKAYAEGEVWLSATKACEYCGVSAPTLKYWFDKGLIGRSKVGDVVRYKKRELDEFMESCYVKKNV